MPRRADGHGDATPGGGADCARVREWIDPYLEELDEPEAGLARAERDALETHAADCPDCRAEIALARRLRRELRDGLPLLACPPEVSDAVLRTAREEAEAAEAVRRDGAAGTGLRDRLRAWLAGGDRPVLWPALAAAALLLLVLAGPLLYRVVTGAGARDAAPAVAGAPDSPAGGAGAAGYSAAEIAEAEEQARMVLAYVASVGRDAGRAVRDDVFDPGIARPTRQAVEGLQAAGLAGEPDRPERPGRAGRNRP